MKKIIILSILFIIPSLLGQTSDSKYWQQMYDITHQVLQQEQQAKASHLQTLNRNYTLEKKSLTLNQSDFDAVYYDLDMTITSNPNNLDGTVTGVFRSKVNGLTQAELDFDSREGISNWQNFSVTGNVSSYTHSNWVLTVQLDQTYDIGEIP